MHWHECNTHTFNLFRKSSKAFSYTIFPVKKINVGKVFKKLLENRYSIILSIHILKLKISGCDSHAIATLDASSQ
jgi:hypothetical protein